ncbi:MAG: pyridoxamine 5'-phosphate oxidase family protein [Ilumatobacteraceae bacterium]
MSLESAYEFLGSQELLVICTASKDGVPHAAPSFYALDGQDVLISISDKSRTGSNLSANPVAAIAAGDAPDPGQTWDDAKGIQIQAAATLLSGADADAAKEKIKAAYSHLGDSVLQSHCYRLKATSVDYIRNAPDGDEEFEPLGVDWTRETY